MALNSVLFLTITVGAQSPGLVLRHALDLNGNGFFADSYDSTDATKSTAGRYDTAKYSGNQGSLMAYDGLTNSAGIGNAQIYGTLHIGPGSSVYLGPTGGIGPHGSQVNDVTTARNLGYILEDASLNFPSISLPADYTSYLTPTSGTLVTWSNYVSASSTNSLQPPSTAPPGGVGTNVTWGTQNVYPTPPPPGMTTNIAYNYQSTYPTPPPAGLLTNSNTYTNQSSLPNPPYYDVSTNSLTQVTTTSGYPTAGTYIGSVTTNYVGGTGNIKSYTFNAIVGRTYDYTLYSYGVPNYTYNIPHYSYTYSVFQTNTTYSTNSYDYVLNANCKYQAASLGGRVCVAGPNVVLVLPNGLTGAENFTFNAGANVLVFAGGRAAAINGNQYFNPNASPASFVLLCGPSVTFLAVNGNGQFTGVLAAPQAAVKLNGGGTNNEDFCGALVAHSVTLNGHYSFHFDEALGRFLFQPPRITQQPLSQTALPGSSVSLEVGINVGSPLQTAQWRLNGTALPGATGYWLTLPNVQSNNVGSYDLVIQSPFGTVTSQVATVSLTLTPDFLWARSGSNVLGSGPSGGSWADALAHDSWGDVSVAGRFSAPSLDLGGTVLTNAAGNNFLCQYESSGLLYWAKQAGFLPVSGLPHAQVGTDANGNVYWAAHFTGTANFDGVQLTNAGTADLFLAKFSPWGGLTWVRQINAYNPQDYTPTFGFVIDPAGTVFLAGSYAGSATFGNLVLTNTGGYLAKYDPAGNLVWAVDAPPAQALALGPSGVLYLSASGGAGTLAKYDAQGTLLWSKPFPRATAMATDDRDNLFATGYGAGTYDGLTLTNVNGLRDFFVAKSDASGTMQWLRQIGSTREQRGLALALDHCGGVFVSSVSAEAQPDPTLCFGAFSLTNVYAFVAEYDTAGNALWAKPLLTSQAAAVWGLDALAPGVVGVAGYYHPTLTLGNFSFTEDAQSQGSCFVAQLAGLVPPQLAAPVATGGSPFQLTVGGASGFRCLLEGSTNLQDWVSLATNTVPFNFTDSEAASYSSRYYRVSYRP